MDLQEMDGQHIKELSGILEDVIDHPHNGGVEAVNLGFVTVGINRKKAEGHREDLLRVLKNYPHQDRLMAGPSYIEVGEVIGDQEAALKLFALGKVLGLWEIVKMEVEGSPWITGFGKQ